MTDDGKSWVDVTPYIPRTRLGRGYWWVARAVVAWWERTLDQCTGWWQR